MIETRRLSKVYSRGSRSPARPLAHVDKGEFVFLTGPSGAGKSTFLRLLLMQERPTEGEVFVNGHNLAMLSRREIQEYRRGIGFVFQDFKLIPQPHGAREHLVRAEVLGVSPRSSSGARSRSSSGWACSTG